MKQPQINMRFRSSIDELQIDFHYDYIHRRIPRRSRLVNTFVSVSALSLISIFLNGNYVPDGTLQCREFINELWDVNQLSN